MAKKRLRLLESHLQNITKRRLNIENSPRCTLECSMCKRTTYFRLNETKTIPGRDFSPDDLLKVIKYFPRITFGGQLSDPIFNKDFIELLEICRDNNIDTRVLTAATGRKKDWYKKAYQSHPQARWTFGIDGPPHLSHNYRKNQDGEHLFNMMLLAREMNIGVFWQYIVFSYNEKYIDECIELAKSHGIRMDFIYSQRNVSENFKPKKNIQD